MKLKRTMAKRLALGGVLGASLIPWSLWAQAAWPSKPIHLVVPFSAGGANDLMGRAAAEGVAKALDQTVVVDNKPGAGGALGAAWVAKSAADGHTFLISAAGTLSNPMIKSNVGYKDEDLVPVALIALSPSMILVPYSAPYQNLKELVQASQKGDGFHFATAGSGSTPHFVAEILNQKYGAKLQVVPYKSGSESTSAVMGGQVQATSEASIIALPHVLHDGKFKALANTWTQRLSVYPQLSTAAEQGFAELKIAHWAGVHAPKGTPVEVLDKMAAAVNQAMKDPAISQRLKTMGIEPMGGTRADFVRFTQDERKRLGEIVRMAHMKDN